MKSTRSRGELDGKEETNQGLNQGREVQKMEELLLSLDPQSQNQNLLLLELLTTT